MLDDDIRNAVHRRVIKKRVDFFHASGRSTNGNDMVRVSVKHE
jgi:hypothetical protein